MNNPLKYNVHPDYAKFRSFPFPFNGIVTALLNKVIYLDVLIRQRHAMAKATKHWVTSKDRSYFPVYEFRPDNAAPDQPLPAMVYYHGGAFVLGYAGSHVANVVQYANRAQCAVFMVDYRLAPKHIFPKGFDDCYAALEWVAEKADWLHIDKNRIAVMGDSAGGCFSAGVAQKAFDEKRITLRGQGLIYPAVDNSCSTFSATQFFDAPIFNGVANKKMWDVYLPGTSASGVINNAQPYATPANRQDLTGLPPAFVETAECDPLRDEGLAYAKRLREAGVSVTEHAPKGTIHGYDMLAKNALTEEAIQRRSDFLKTVFV
ncbi:MAG TPA: alpha/beta hydrolase [Pseudomonadales bacterium]|nr:alpha/beta hydrolase [Pseudomonadales bacterium]